MRKKGRKVDRGERVGHFLFAEGVGFERRRRRRRGL